MAEDPEYRDRDPWPGSTCKEPLAVSLSRSKEIMDDRMRSQRVLRNPKTVTRNSVPDPHGRSSLLGPSWAAEGGEEADLLIERYGNGVINTL